MANINLKPGKKVIEVHAGMERNGTMIRETLKEATQSERVQQTKKSMANFFKPKSSIPEPSIGKSFFCRHFALQCQVKITPENSHFGGLY